ncbi:MAG: hypothetical protein QM820_47600 [Minicystis sp.]
MNTPRASLPVIASVLVFSAGCSTPSGGPVAGSSSAAVSGTSPAPAPPPASRPPAAELILSLAQACVRAPPHDGKGRGGSKVDFAYGARFERAPGGAWTVRFSEESASSKDSGISVQVDAQRGTCDGRAIALPAVSGLDPDGIVAAARACAERAPRLGRGMHKSPLRWDGASLTKSRGAIGTPRWQVWFPEQHLAIPSGLALEIDERSGSCTEVPLLD